jgi:hypothetical protein
MALDIYLALSGVERLRAASSAVERRRAPSSAVERRRAASSGVERRRAASSGVERRLGRWALSDTGLLHLGPWSCPPRTTHPPRPPKLWTPISFRPHLGSEKFDRIWTPLIKLYKIGAWGIFFGFRPPPGCWCTGCGGAETDTYVTLGALNLHAPNIQPV